MGDEWETILQNGDTKLHNGTEPDIALCKKEGGYYGHPNFGMPMFCPVLISMMLTIPHWWRIEKTWRRKLSTLVLNHCSNKEKISMAAFNLLSYLCDKK